MSRIKEIYRFFSSRYQSVHLDYPVTPRPRYGHGLPPHPELYAIVNRNREGYAEVLQAMLNHTEAFRRIQKEGNERDHSRPVWNNGFLPGLDILAIYTLIAERKPSQYIEIGSGNSTKVAQLAKRTLNLNTRIISIDPMPRAEIDALADEVIRKPFESLDIQLHEKLQPGDILFIDNSHRILPNSDAMVFFMEVLPRLKPGVILHVHDIYIPYDYPDFMCERYYSEQYGLAAFLLANPERFSTLLPNYFISQDDELRSILKPLWNSPELEGVEQHGGSYWMEIK